MSTDYTPPQTFSEMCELALVTRDLDEYARDFITRKIGEAIHRAKSPYEIHLLQTIWVDLVGSQTGVRQ